MNIKIFNIEEVSKSHKQAGQNILENKVNFMDKI